MNRRRQSASIRPWLWWGLAAPFAVLALAIPAFFLLHAAGGALLGLAILFALAALQYPFFRLVLGRRAGDARAEDRDLLESK